MVGYRAAIVTGASSGLGAELARQLGRRGVSLGLIARREDRLEEVAREIAGEGGRVTFRVADVAEPVGLRRAILELADELGPIDLVVANAGIGGSGRVGEAGTPRASDVIGVNLLGAITTIEAVLPGMIERGGGHVVGISSLTAYRGVPFAAAYSASKAGLSTWLEALRIEVAPHGIVVTTVHPGFVRTPMIEGSANRQPLLWEADAAARYILKRMYARRRVIDFPWPLVATLRLTRWLPGSIYDPLARILVAGRTTTLKGPEGSP